LSIFAKIKYSKMKKIILIITLLFTFLSFSQNIYTFKSGGRILENGKLISPTEIRELIRNNKEALEVYNSGRNKKTFGNVLLYGGIVTMIGKIAYDATHPPKLIQTAQSSYTYGPYNNTAYIYNYAYEPAPSRALYFIGAGFIISSIPIKIGFSNKIRQAIALINKDARTPKTTFVESSEIIANSNGIGISIKF
jgi:hypothetical protein